MLAYKHPLKQNKKSFSRRTIKCKQFQVYFGVSTLLDATSSDSLKAEDEQREVIL